MIEHLGTTPAQRSDGHTCSFHVWGHIEADGTISAISYGISSIIACAHGPILRQNCLDTLQQTLLQFADTTATGLTFDDGTVIEDWPK